uniref:Secreted protein n=1 Tax=Arundo donax TaxID=35708 RepID=A0A0A9BK90_ARUDO
MLSLWTAPHTWRCITFRLAALALHLPGGEAQLNEASQQPRAPLSAPAVEAFSNSILECLSFLHNPSLRL